VQESDVGLLLAGRGREVSSCLLYCYNVCKGKERLIYDFDMNRTAVTLVRAYYRTCRRFGKHTM